MLLCATAVTAAAAQEASPSIAALPAAAPAAATAPPASSPATALPRTAPSRSLRLQVQPQVNALPQTLTAPTKAQAPTAIHTFDWGVFNRDGGVPAGFGPVARYGTDRAYEDWSYLKDPTLSDDFFDPLKFIPLNGSKSVYLTLSGDERLKNWFENRPFLGQQTPNDSGRFTVRGIYGADLHLGDYFRVYGELVNGDAAGWGGYGYNSTYRTRLDVQQLFAEAKVPVGEAQLGFVAGRQEFLDAPNYVLFARETPDVPLSWDGFRAYAVLPRVRIDAWDFVQTNTSPQQLFHDNENYNARLFGAYESWAPPDFTFLGQPGHTFLDFFYIGYELGGTPAAIATAVSTAAGSTIRDNYGTRFWGKAGPVEFSLGGIYQGGQFRYAKSSDVRDVEAYAINTSVGWRFHDVPTKPILTLQTDLYSGGNDRHTTGTVGTYAAPYNPQTNYLDTTTYLAPSNLIDTGPVLEFSPAPIALIRVKVPVFWRDSTDDAVYGSSRIYSYRANYSGGFVGVTPQITLALRLTRHLTWNQDFARFLASTGLSRAGAESGSYYLSTLDYRF